MEFFADSGLLGKSKLGEEASVNLFKQGAVDYILKDRLARLPESVDQAIEDARHKRQLRASEERYRLLMESSHWGSGTEI